MQRVRSGARPFVSLDALHRENLDEALREHGVDPGGFAAADLDALARAWHFLPPWPDSAAGIAAIKRGYIVGPLSNGNTSLLLDMAKAAGLDWDLILGSDLSRAYKPDPEAYRWPAALLGLEPGEVMLAAAHDGDLASAREAGPGHGVHRAAARARAERSRPLGSARRLGSGRDVDHGDRRPPGVSAVPGVSAAGFNRCWSGGSRHRRAAHRRARP